MSDEIPKIEVTQDMRMAARDFADRQRAKVAMALKTLQEKQAKTRSDGVIDPTLRNNVDGCSVEFIIWNVIVQELNENVARHARVEALKNCKHEKTTTGLMFGDYITTCDFCGAEC